jgi:hypothetical protein
MYNVGFGDCFLVTFPYAPGDGGDRHILIDFGSTAAPKNAAPDLMVRVAKDIEMQCGGKLTAVVATHRHKDHISGFATLAGGKGPGDVAAKLQPQLVVQPWTEHPDAAPDATAPPSLPVRAVTHIRGLYAAQQFAGDFLRMLAAQRTGLASRLALSRQTATELAFLGEDNIQNHSAVKNLIQMGQAGRAKYVNCGSSSGLEQLLPGVKVHVLGPPALKQSDEIKSQVEKDPAEFWMMQAAIGRWLAPPSKRAGVRGRLFPRARTVSLGRVPPHTRWFMHQIERVHVEQLRSIVRALDDALNNTSVILLFEVNGKRLLFSGDAQIENWRFALSQPRFRKLLADVTMYKVGHHGSRNATPKSLWGLFKNRGPTGKQKRLHTLVSTLAGKHGSAAENTEVPRQALVDELKKNSDFRTTQGYSAGQLSELFEF